MIFKSNPVRASSSAAKAAEARPELCDAVLEALGLLELADRHPMSLSGGQKQRVAIASAMLSGKDFIVLDEPTSGLDYYHMTQVAPCSNS